MADLNTLIKFYERVQSGSYQYDKGKIVYKTINKFNVNSYVRRLRAYDRKWNNGKTFSQLQSIVKKKCTDPIACAMNYFDNVFVNANPTEKIKSTTAADYKCAYKNFCETILGRYFANVWFGYVLAEKPQTSVYEMIAANAIFASPEVVNELINSNNPHACWFSNPNFFIRDQENKNKPTFDVKERNCIGDDNTKANKAIKSAVRKSCPEVDLASIGYFRDFEACHIVPDTTNNIDYFTSIPNLCLLPRAIAGLTDHLQDVIDILNYHAFTLYNLPYKKPQLSNSLMKIYKSLIWRVNYL